MQNEMTEELAEQTVDEAISAEQAASENTENDTQAELAALREEVRQLTEELEKKQAEAERVATQIGDFYALFPDTPIEKLPESVWEDVRQGNSLVAAYAIYNRRLQLKAENAERVNAKNASLSAGKAGTGTVSEYFTPDEVRAMSQREVRANYEKIIRSMKKWN